ncbi:DVU_1553 family AMP-dependent CoA ligase [Desulfotalea psychrophila]|uniref:Related to coenzyme F390 synthetase n=1 Tax=Desulfotalea psychrophila (strain LSv54 / DSM 12343) TaxID=177439 RepID=Q6ARN2_DESPS|nr:AMP-binding protein [Desulfotalea psychrophila]CAG34993.1 related to coenzyme F390 synthetase [Desulfotalea psychrophila LSv54]
MALSHLDRLLLRRMGMSEESSAPTAEEMSAWQLKYLQKTILHAREKSPFYRRHFAGLELESLDSLQAFSALPRVTADDLRAGPEQFLCVSQDEIARAVTVQSSGTTGAPKRIFYTESDLQATVDYFDAGMAHLVAAGQTAFLLMPTARPGGVGRLLVEGLERRGVHIVSHGMVDEVAAAVDHLLQVDADCVIGPAAHLNLLACEWARRGLGHGQIASVLLCWDAPSTAVVHNIERIWGCRAYRHWGMIETGLGGAVQCAPHSGMHLREADIFLEITDPETGQPLPDGKFGELVLTTLQRWGMPLIRYRSGDLGRILADTCPCGSTSRRLDPWIRRLPQDSSPLLTIDELNEALYSVAGLADFSASLAPGRLGILACGRGGSLESAIRVALKKIPTIFRAIELGSLQISIEIKNDGRPAVPGLAKRCLQIDEER